VWHQCSKSRSSCARERICARPAARRVSIPTRTAHGEALIVSGAGYGARPQYHSRNRGTEHARGSGNEADERSRKATTAVRVV
jgi:hypothetical protein